MEALYAVVRLYNAEVGHRSKAAIRVIHGYGSSGVGGVIRHALRPYLMAHGIRYETGEHAEHNPGVTIVMVRREPIEDDLSRLRRGGLSREEHVRLFADMRDRFEKLMEERDPERAMLWAFAERHRRDRDALARKLCDREEEVRRNAVQTEDLEAKQAELERSSRRTAKHPRRVGSSSQGDVSRRRTALDRGTPKGL